MAPDSGRDLRILAAAILALSVALPACADEPAGAAGEAFFRERIEPVLKAECFRCHSHDAQEIASGLKLDSRAAARRGGESGAAVVPGKPTESLLLQAIRHEGGLAMPPKRPKLPEAVIADFSKWIEMGAPDPRADADDSADEVWPREAREHWAFQPLTKSSLPATRDRTWAQNPLDAFILAQLETRTWRPAPQASRGELVRRLTFDLTGLPPSSEEVAAFVADDAPDAYERLVDRLLDSPRYGERWGQHWLDVVRFAESEGYEYDRDLPDAFRFRDYVIDALNGDLPFDRFVAEQLAGDELEPENHALLAASAFHRLGPVRRNAGNPEIALSRNEVLTERTDIVGTAFLGLTVGCARCHNHKLEPISQRDYYRLQAYFAATEEHNVSLASPAETAAWETETKRIKDEIERLRTIARSKTGPERVELANRIEALEDELPGPPSIIPATHNDLARRTPIHVLRRGVWENKGMAAGPRPLSVLVADELPELAADVPDPRTRLARWLTGECRELTARVIVNRLWQHHFGAGLVKTPNDFGTRAERPSHPELLDWLAAELIDGGWRLKPVQRLIVLSATYRQASGPPRDEVDADPENRLLRRFNRRRLAAEELRDAMLVVAGRIDLAMGGPSVMTRVDPELVGLLYKPMQWRTNRQPSQHDRRSVYLKAKRNLRLPFFEAFDAPALLSSCARRDTSIHAPQALELLNGTIANELSRAFARRLHGECGDAPEAQVERAWRLAFGRSPTSREREKSLAYLRDGSLDEFALALFNLNEFAYVP